MAAEEVWRRTGESEIQGSLHCAMDDKTVHCFGRDDVVRGVIIVIFVALS